MKVPAFFSVVSFPKSFIKLSRELNKNFSEVHFYT